MKTAQVVGGFLNTLSFNTDRSRTLQATVERRSLGYPAHNTPLQSTDHCGQLKIALTFLPPFLTLGMAPGRNAKRASATMYTFCFSGSLTCDSRRGDRLSFMDGAVRVQELNRAHTSEIMIFSTTQTAIKSPLRVSKALTARPNTCLQACGRME